VFDAIAARSESLRRKIGAVTKFGGELIHLVAFHGTSPAPPARSARST